MLLRYTTKNNVWIALLMAGSIGCTTSITSLGSRSLKDVVANWNAISSEERIERLYTPADNPCGFNRPNISTSRYGYSWILPNFSKINLQNMPSPEEVYAIAGLKPSSQRSLCLHAQTLSPLRADRHCTSKRFKLIGSHSTQNDKFYSAYYKHEDSLLQDNDGLHYCHKHMAASIKDIYKKEYDVSAEFISHWSETYIEHWWTKEQESLNSSVNKYKKHINHIQEQRLIYLNKVNTAKKAYAQKPAIARETKYGKAYDYDLLIAKKLLAASEREIKSVSPSLPTLASDLQNLKELNLSASRLWQDMLACTDSDPENTRLNYYTAKWNCSPKSKLNGNNIKARILALLGHCKNIIVGGGLIPFEFRNTPKQISGIILQIEMMAKSKINSLINKQSLVPTAHPLFVQLLLQVIADEIPIQHNMDYDAYVAYNEFINNIGYEQRFFNVIGFFNTFPLGDCRPLGLWPSANQAAATAIYNRILEIGVSNHQTRDQLILIDPRAIHIPCRNKVLPPFYYNNKKQIALGLRKISERYINTNYTK